MKRIVKQALVLVFALVSLQSQLVSAKKCNDLILIFDSLLAEKTDVKSHAMAIKFMDALQERVAPIIVSSNIVENFCFWKTDNKQMLETIKQESLRSKNINSAKEKALELLMKTDPSKRFNDPYAYLSLMLSGIELSSNEWDCYMHKHADLILLVPKAYSARRAPGIKSESAHMAACGFNVTNLDKITDISPQSILQFMQSRKIKKPTTMIDRVKSMFKSALYYIQLRKIKNIRTIVDAVESMIIIENGSDTTQSVSWNVYISGHGGPAKKKKILKEIFQQDQKALIDFQGFAKADRERGDIESEKSNMHWVESISKRVALEQLLLQSAHNLSDEAVVPQSARVAGIGFDDCTQLMSFFNKNIETNFVHCSTCFGGGYNQTFLNDVLQKFKVNFIVASEGSSESLTYGFAPALELNAGGALVLSNKGFTNFFGLLENFFGEPTKIVGMKAPQGWQEDPIATIVNTVAPKTIENQPSVRIPAVGVFTALNVDKKVKILTNTVVKAHELEGRTINLTHPAIEVLIVYPAFIGVPVKMKSLLRVISPTPQKVEQLYKTTHIFEEIISDSMLCYLISDFVRLNSSYSKITFVIKNLTCFNYAKSGLEATENRLSIKNMIIHIAGNLSINDSIDADINVACMIDGKSYSLSHHVNNLASNIDLPFILESMPLSSSLGNVVDKIFEPRELAQLREKSVPAMVDYFENVIDKTSAVQKTGALKKVLLLKKLEGIEKAIAPEALKAQKEWLEKNKKPAAHVAKSLERHKKDLVKLKDDLEKLTSREISQEERDKALNKIKNVEAKIDKEFSPDAGK